MVLDVLEQENLMNSKIVLSSSFIERLKSFEGSREQLKSIVLKTYELSTTLFPDSKEIIFQSFFFDEFRSANKETVLSKEDLNENSSTKYPEKQTTSRKTSENNESKKLPFKKVRLNRTIGLLDKYEEAVVRLLNADQPILGKNIAASCEPPISAPALTDSIKKHRERILFCFKEYPDKWPLIKTHYEPLMNSD